MMILERDTLRRKVELESQGKQTVLYTAKGQPSYMNVIPLMNCEELGQEFGQGPHPAFITKAQVHSEFFYGTYAGVVRQGELISLPEMKPAAHLDFDTAVQLARANGQGWHLSTNAERAFLMLWCQKQHYAQSGNTENGHSIIDPTEQGQRVDHGDLDYPAGNPATYTGSGPDKWRHDHSPYGIADLCGNMWEWQTGLRLVDGEIQIIANNDASHADLAKDSSAWQALNLLDGRLISVGQDKSAKYDAPSANLQGNAGTPILSHEILNYNGPLGELGHPSGLMDGEFQQITCTTGQVIAPIFKCLGLFPNQAGHDQTQVYLGNYGERIMLAGGAWYSGHAAGLAALCLSHSRHHQSLSTGARPACIL